MLFGPGRLGRQILHAKGSTSITNSDGSALSLSFLNAGSIDGRIAFARSTTASYIDSSGVIQSAAINAPRWDYDPVTHALNGLLMEGSRTNLLFNSSDFTNVSWTKNNCTLASGIVGPNGALTGSGLTSNNGVTGFISQGGITPTLAAYTASIYAKAGSLSTIIMLWPAAWWVDATTRLATFDLSLGVISSVSSDATATITPVGNDWYRCSMTATPTAAVSAALQIARAGGNGNGVTVQTYVWGAQFELGPFITSYIPTAGTSVARGVDTCTIPGTGWLSSPPAGGTLLVEALHTITKPTAISASQAPVVLGKLGVTTDRIQFYNPANSPTQINAFISAGNVQYMAQTIGTEAAGKPWRAAMTFATGYCNACVDGGDVTHNVTALPSSVIDGMSIGHSSSNAQQFDGHIRLITYWSRVLSDDELQAVTKLGV